MNRRASRRALALAMAGVALWTLGWALVALGARATYGARVTADEPQYLVTAVSLGEDVDLDISDELRERRFLPFHEIDLNQQTRPLNDDGQRLSPHDPLLPLLLALPMRVGGWAAAKATLAVFAALTSAAALWLAVRRLGVSLGVGAGVVAAFFAAPPLVAYGSQVYPEMPAALCVTLGVAAVTSRGRRDRGESSGRCHDRLVAAGCEERALGWGARLLAAGAVVALPWLSVKYVPLAAVVAIAAAVSLWRRDRRTLVAETLFYALAGVSYLWLHQRIYGGWTVYAAGDHFTVGEFTVVGRQADYLGRSRRLVGLLADREFGLVAWMPAYALLPVAMAVLVRLRPPRWPVVAATVAAGYAVATWVAFTMHGWWWPGRQLVVVLPVAVAVMAFAAQQFAAVRWTVAGSWVVAALSWVWLAVEASTGRRTLIVDFAQTANPWYQAWSTLLPDYQSFGSAGSLTRHWLWALLLVAGAVIAWQRCTGPPADRAARGNADAPHGSSATDSSAERGPPSAQTPANTLSGSRRSRVETVCGMP